MTVLDFSLNDLFCIRVGKDAMEISYLIGIATRGFNTEYQLKEVCITKHTEGVGGSEAKAVPRLPLHVLLARENAALVSRWGIARVTERTFNKEVKFTTKWI